MCAVPEALLCVPSRTRLGYCDSNLAAVATHPLQATASTKKEAEQQCARQALQLLETTTHGLPTAGGGPAAGPPCFIDAMSQFSAGSYTWTTSLPSVAGVPVGADAPPTPVCPDDLASPHELRAALQAALAREARLISLLRHTHDQLDAAINDALAGGPDSSPHGGGTAASKDRRQ